MNFRAFFQKHKAYMIIFSIAVALRLGLFFVYLNFNHGDFIGTVRGADGYFEISENLIAGNGYSESAQAPFVPNAMRPPAWIVTMALIAKIFHSYVPVYIFQLILSSLIPILGMYLAGKIFPSRYTWLVGLFLALEPAAIYSSTMVVSETSFTFLFLLFLVFIFRYLDSQATKSIALAGFFLGLSILIKPTVQFLPIIIPVLLLLHYRKQLSLRFFKQLLCFVFVVALVLLPWVLRNKKEFGVWGLTAQPAYNLYTVLVPTVLSIDKGTSYESELSAIPIVDEVPGGPADLSNSRFYTDKSVAVLMQHKVALLKSMGISMVTFFTHDHMLTVLGYGGISIPNVLHKPALVLLLTDPLELARDILMYASSPGIFVLLVRLFWIAITLLFFAGAALYLYKEKFSPFAYTGLIMVAYFAVLTSANGFGMNGRFRIPVNVFIFTFAVYGFVVLRRCLIKKWFPNA
ncbi:MAG: glycosyltransferase family 39 protein [Patescibacteria group bacterium]